MVSAFTTRIQNGHMCSSSKQEYWKLPENSWNNPQQASEREARKVKFHPDLLWLQQSGDKTKSVAVLDRRKKEMQEKKDPSHFSLSLYKQLVSVRRSAPI